MLHKNPNRTGMRVPTYFPIILISWFFRLKYLMPKSSTVHSTDRSREIKIMMPVTIRNRPISNCPFGISSAGDAADPVAI